MESSEIPKFSSYNDDLTTEIAKKHHQALLQQMHTLAASADTFINKPAIYNSMFDEFKSLQKLSFFFISKVKYIMNK